MSHSVLKSERSGRINGQMGGQHALVADCQNFGQAILLCWKKRVWALRAAGFTGRCFWKKATVAVSANRRGTETQNFATDLCDDPKISSHAGTGLNSCIPAAHHEQRFW